VDFAESQRRPGKHPVGLIIVIVLHLLLGWALLSGLARKVVEVVKAPIETKIIEEVKPPPPPPPENLPASQEPAPAAGLRAAARSAGRAAAGPDDHHHERAAAAAE
jgi:protein TonB